MTIIVTLHLRRMTVLMMSSILQLIETFSQTYYHHLPGDNGSDMTLMTLFSSPNCCSHLADPVLTPDVSMCDLGPMSNCIITLS